MRKALSVKQGRVHSKRAIKQKKIEPFVNRLATIMLVQTKLLPPSALGIKNLKSKI